MHYIRHINNRLLLQMTYKMYPFIAGILFFFSACTSSPFIELNSRDNFQLEGGTKFSVSLNRDNLPVEMDPILIENLGEAVTNYLEGTGPQLLLSLALIVKIKLKLMISVTTVIQFIDHTYMILIALILCLSFIYESLSKMLIKIKLYGLV